MILTPNKIQEIENQTLDVLAEVYGDLENVTPPIDVNRIMKKNKIKLKFGKFTDPEIAGFYDRKKNTISLSADDVLKRQIFTIAHEFGHHILHNNTNEEIFYRRDAFNINQTKETQETEANWFAASLLMPEYLIKRLWPMIKSTKYIGELFNVSNLTSYFRLKNLGLLADKEEELFLRFNKNFNAA
jgi:Zn-dependent peptidase ImmA (M78 family)